MSHELTDHQLLAALYSRFRKLLYLDYLRGAKLLAAHSLGDNSKSYSTWLPNPFDTQSLAPDCCSNCGSPFGLTCGGRLRYRCHYCRRTDNTIWEYEVQQLGSIWGCSQEYVVYLLSIAVAQRTARGGSDSVAS